MCFKHLGMATSPYSDPCSGWLTDSFFLVVGISSNPPSCPGTCLSENRDTLPSLNPKDQTGLSSRVGLGDRLEHLYEGWVYGFIWE